MPNWGRSHCGISVPEGCRAGILIDILLSHNYFLISPRFDIRISIQIVEGIPNVTGIQLDVMDQEGLCKYISQVRLSLAN